MVFILAIVIGLVAWALHLMQQAVDEREFSLMLAGLLVSSAAAALVGVYFIMSDCMTYMSTRAQFYNLSASQSTDVIPWEMSDVSRNNPY